ncbi:MAG: SHOCT domain-containing protein [Planctomycetota bacterium]|nr:SHOCT domain-containing protein [Planctomycetota bacterium]
MLGCSFAALGGWHGWLGMLAGLALLLGAICGLLYLAEARRKHGDRKDSLGILRRRLASGEITAEEFANLRRYL